MNRRRTPDALTPREAEVLALLKQGLKRDQIAKRLKIAPSTVEQHIWRAGHKRPEESR